MDMLLTNRLSNSVINSVMSPRMSFGYRCALFIALICAVSGVRDGYGKLGGDVSFTPDPALSPGGTITWKFKQDVTEKVIRVVRLDYGADAKPQNPLFRENSIADKTSGTLTLQNLKMDHSGLYSFELDGKEQDEKFQLRVMAGVPTPKLKTEPSSNAGNAQYLVCEYNSTIIWSCTETTPKVSPLNGNRQGESVVLENSGNVDVCCTCTLKNEVSEETSAPLCKKDLFPAESSAGMVVGIIIAVILIIIIIFILLYLFSDSFHDQVYNRLKTTRLKGVLASLDRLRTCIKPQPAGPAVDMEKVEEPKGAADEENQKLLIKPSGEKESPAENSKPPVAENNGEDMRPQEKSDLEESAAENSVQKPPVLENNGEDMRPQEKSDLEESAAENTPVAENNGPQEKSEPEIAVL